MVGKILKRRAFLSPIMNPFVVWGLRFVFPVMLQKLFGGLSVKISPKDFSRLREYKGKRMLLLPNHPTGDEPAVLFEIGKWMDETFQFVAAREVFDWEHGFRGWVLRRMGTYSVIRGAADRESFLTSKKILMEGLHRLVIFIEGEISRENDVLIPFEPGVLQLGFWAQEALIKDAKKHQSEVADIYTVPVAIKYFYQPGIEVPIETSLKQLEKAVGLTAALDSDVYTRIRAIGLEVLKTQEEMNRIISLEGTTLNERVEGTKSRMLKKMEVFLDLKPAPNASIIERMREIRNTMDRLIHVYDVPDTLTEYQARLIEHFRLALSEFYKDLDRIAYFLTYDESYLRENQTTERLVEMILRLEREVFGRTHLTHPRTAVVKMGEIFNLKTLYPRYEANKKEFVQELASQMEQDMRGMLTAIENPY